MKVLRDYPDQEIWNRRAIERIFELELGEDIFAGLQWIMSKHRNYPRLSAAAKLEMARRLVDQGQFELALAEYEPLLKFSGEDPLSAAIRAATVFEMAEIHFKRSDFIEAIDLLEKLAAASPRFRSEALNKMYQAYIDRGEKLNRGGDHQLALAMFDQSRRIAHQELEGHRGYIFTMNKMKRGVEAYREYADSAQAHPGDAVLLYCQGLALSYIGEADPAKLGRSTELIESALALDYRMISAYLTLSYNYQAMEELERAGGVKIGFMRRVYNFTAGVMGKFCRAVTFQGEPEEFSGYEIAINTLNQAIVLNDDKSDPAMEAALLLNLANKLFLGRVRLQERL
ncbi:MAG: tetratricopeptide repeat protein [candidate division Zixibacteria bacterium]|nr:tetratricopeptide repeat protein [Candidatus Tariuqbacter arcticus]